MDSARLIATVMLYLIIARGQARPMDMPADLQDASHTEETTAVPVEPEPEEPAETDAQVGPDNLKPEASKSSMANEQTLTSEDFTGGDSENTVTSRTPISKVEESLTDRTTSEGEIPSNDPVYATKLEDMPEEKPEDSSKSHVSDNNEALFSPQHLPSAATISPYPDQNKAFSSEEINTDPAEQPLNPSISTKLQITEHHTPSTRLMQEYTSEHMFDEASNTQHSFTVDKEIHRSDVAISVSETATTSGIPADTQPSSVTIQTNATIEANATAQADSTTQTTPLNLHDEHALHIKTLTTTEKPSSVQISNSTDISERFGHDSPHGEESTSKNIEIEAEGAERASSKGQMTSSSDWLFTAVTVAVAMDGIVKAFSSSSPSFKDTAPSTMPLSTSSLSEEQLSASSFVDPSIPKSRSLPPLSSSSAELPDSSFEDAKILKDQSISSTQPPTIIPVSSSVDIRTTKDSSISTNSLALPSSQVTANEFDFFADTQVAKESLPSTTWSQASTKLPVLDPSQEPTEVPDSSHMDTRISKNASSFMTSLASGSSQKPAEEPESPFTSSSILKDTPSFSSVSTSTLTQAPELPASSVVDSKISMPSSALPSFSASAQLPASPIEDIKISNDLTSIPPTASPLPQMTVDLPVSSIVDTNILKDPPSSSLSPPSAKRLCHSRGNTDAAKTIPPQLLKEVAVSSVAEAKILNPSPASPSMALTQAPEEHLSLEDAKISPLPLSPLTATHIQAEVPLPSLTNEQNSNAAEYVPLNSVENNAPIISSLADFLTMSEEKRDVANLLKLADMAEDMDVAETMVFRPVFSYRQDSAKRRYFRSLPDRRNYL